jgi:hypothetical protein
MDDVRHSRDGRAGNQTHVNPLATQIQTHVQTSTIHSPFSQHAQDQPRPPRNVSQGRSFVFREASVRLDRCGRPASTGSTRPDDSARTSPLAPLRYCARPDPALRGHGCVLRPRVVGWPASCPPLALRCRSHASCIRSLRIVRRVHGRLGLDAGVGPLAPYATAYGPWLVDQGVARK